MSTKPGLIKCYDTMSGKYVMVEVSKEIQEFMYRSYWKEDMQNRRYLKRKVSITDDVEFLFEGKDIFDLVVSNLEKEQLNQVVNRLNKREKEIVYHVYCNNLNLSEAAREIGISATYVSQLNKRLIERLRVDLVEERS